VDFRSRLEKALSRPSVRLDLADSASVALILRSGPEMLWIRRAENPNDPWSGHMGFPGGRSEPGDPDPRRTAERETLEEIGVALSSCADYLGTLDEVQVRNRFGLQPFKLVPHLFWLHGPCECVIDSKEVHWIPLAHLGDPANRTTHGSYPGIQYADRVIWGLSYRVLTDLLSRLGFPLNSMEP
jgi:8-oxo-dGTP pyrophosphatase MutT (NUDIX family)